MKMSFKNFESYLSTFSSQFEKKLLDLIPQSSFFSNKLDQAMKYVICVGGKRIRPLFVNEISSIFNVNSQYSDRVAASIEFIHCYSLVHDDLPAMDDDDLRRGHLTCHRKFDEATAILVGDAFQSLAFEIISNSKTHTSSEVRCSLIAELAQSSGILGMVGGQMLDLEAEKQSLDLEKIYQLQKLKTGELFRFSCIAPCILAKKKRELKIFEEFSNKLGLAFQIKDDLLDVEGDESEVGKKTRKDLKMGKETLVSLLGKKNAKLKSIELIQDSIDLIKPFGKKAKNLIELTNYIISRKK